MNEKSVILQCDDHRETLVFLTEDGAFGEPEGFEFMIQDAYANNMYSGFFGRIRLAWRAFKSKPVNYTGIYTEDREKVRGFLQECLNSLDKKGYR